MKIACIGNMNNMLSPTAQYLAEEGHDVSLILLYEYDHFAPEADYFDKSKILFKIEKLQMDFGEVMAVSKDRLLKVFSGYDYYIGTDYAPALLYRINLKLNIFYPAGTDIYDWPFYEYKTKLPKLWQFVKIRTAKYQMKGILKSDILSISSNNSYLDQKISKLGFKKKIINPLPFLYYKQYNENYFKQSQFYSQIKEIRESNDILLIQHGRQWWKSAPSELNKGNDKLVLGIKQFLNKKTKHKLKLILIEYGTDTEETKKLIHELKLEEYVTWFPIMSRKNLMGIISLSDMGVGEIGTESWYLYCSNAEILACNIPFMGYRNDSYHIVKGDYLFPMANVSNANEICNELLKLVDRQKSKVKSDSANEWLIEYNFNKPINEILNNLSEKKSFFDINQIIEKSFFDIKMYLLELFAKSFFHISKIIFKNK